MQPSPPAPAPEQPGQEDPFRWGCRFRKVALPDGTTDLVRIPLTLEDLLHPEEEDEHAVRPRHIRDCFLLYGVFNNRLPGPAVSWASTDWRVEWDHPTVLP